MKIINISIKNILKEYLMSIANVYTNFNDTVIL